MEIHLLDFKVWNFFTTFPFFINLIDRGLYSSMFRSVHYAQFQVILANGQYQYAVYFKFSSLTLM